eukprot:6633480-Pyramimonas_sp.AAC.1
MIRYQRARPEQNDPPRVAEGRPAPIHVARRAGALGQEQAEGWRLPPAAGNAVEQRLPAPVDEGNDAAVHPHWIREMHSLSATFT